MSSSANRTGTVHTLGRVAWPALVAEVGDARCVWADLEGFHGGEACPEEPVLATHLWAWAGTRAWRFRIDGPIAYGARLDLGEGDASVVVSPIRERDPQGQDYPVDLGELAESLRLATTIEANPLTFLIEG